MNRLLFKKTLLMIGLLLCLTTTVTQAQRLVAITIDDLPFVGESKNFHLNKIIETLKANGVPVTGFVIASEVTENNMPMLQKFRDAGFGVGNHTLTHANLNRMDTQAYIDEIKQADKILKPVLTRPKYFRFPYLVVGQGEKKERVMNYLALKHYHVAPITIDSRDFVFNQLLMSVPEKERRFFMGVLKPCYIDFIWEQTLKAEEHNRVIHKPDQPQILLIHANLLNAYALEDIINLYRQNGYHFVSLDDALYTAPPGKTGSIKRRLKHFYDTQIEEFVAWD